MKKLKQRSVALAIFAVLSFAGWIAPAYAKASPSPEGVLKVHFIDVGHGDSCLIQCPDGENILIDAGSGYDYGSSSPIMTVTRYLKERGIKKIDLLIATHPHSDHVGGLTDILENFPVKMVLDPGKTHTTYAYRRFMEAVKAHPGTEYKLGRAGQKYNFGDVKLSILHPTDELSKKINDCSIVCRLVWGKTSFLFTGDAMKDAEKEILRRRYPIRSTVLKVGHHGSNSSSTKAFLRAVSPRVAVISCAPRKSIIYGDSKVIDRLKTGRTSVYRTDKDGTIIVECTGKDCRVKLLKEEE